MILKPMGTPGKCPAHNRTWTQEDDELLTAMHSSMTYEEMARQLGRSTSATRHRAMRLRMAGKLPYKHHYFTPEQDKFIRDNHQTMTVRKMAEVLSKHPYTVMKRARKMGITFAKFGDLHHKTKHPDSDVELIRELHDYGISFAEIARKFELYPGAVYYLYHYRLTAADAIAREYLPR
ncbi:AsnC family protein [Salmonella enterica subsp. enterica serovar Minnesota]|nr:AsnC family protein [Salmonella enterica subsp. enterica serovar Minnesota]